MSDGEDRADMYQATTRAIRVTVRPQYLADQSDPSQAQFVWAYHVRLENTGTETVQLRARHWKIRDGNGRLQEVKGPGVVGKTPVLRPGQSFEYSSGTPLSTPSGIMSGTYQMVSEGGEQFDVEIPAFSLDSPATSRSVN
jgi:ApaG protein